jgi:hypothetical protein
VVREDGANGSCIFVFGGDNGNQRSDAFSCFNVKDRHWFSFESETTALPAPRAYHSAVQIKSSFNVGDVSDNSSSISEAAISGSPTTAAGAGSAAGDMAAEHSQMIVFGGWGPHDFLGDLAVIDLDEVCSDMHDAQNETAKAGMSAPVSALRELSRRMIRSLDVRDRHWNLACFQRTFIGAEALRYLVDQRFATDAQHAAHILKDMLQLGLVHDAMDTETEQLPAQEGAYSLYRFGSSAGLPRDVKCPPTPTDDVHSIVHQGWMMKLVEGNNQGWKKKYVVLRGNSEMAYFDKPPALGADGCSTQVREYLEGILLLILGGNTFVDTWREYFC